jgi:hypothetical protein
MDIEGATSLFLAYMDEGLVELWPCEDAEVEACASRLCRPKTSLATLRVL